MRIPPFLGWGSVSAILYLALYWFSRHREPGPTILAALAVLLLVWTLLLVVLRGVFLLLRRTHAWLHDLADRKLYGPFLRRIEVVLARHPHRLGGAFATLALTSPRWRVRTVELLVRNLDDERPGVRAAAVEWLVRVPAGAIQAALQRPKADDIWTRLLDGLLLNDKAGQGARVLCAVVQQDRKAAMWPWESASRSRRVGRKVQLLNFETQGALHPELDGEALRRAAVAEQALRVVFETIAPPVPRPLRERLLASVGQLTRQLETSAGSGESVRVVMVNAFGGKGNEHLLDHLCVYATENPDEALVAPLKELVRILRPIMQSDQTILSGERDEHCANENTSSHLLAALGACGKTCSASVSLSGDRRTAMAYDAKRAAVSQALGDAIKRHNRLVELHNQQLEEFDDPPDTFTLLLSGRQAPYSGLKATVEQIQESAVRILTLRSEIAGLENRLWSELSPASILLRVAEDETSYCAFVRQGAIRGIGYVLEQETLRGEDRKEITERTTSALTGDSLAHVRTWEVRLRRNSSLTDTVLALHVGLSWLGRHVGSGQFRPRVSELIGLVQQLRARLPRAVDFLEKHPLRLMTLADRRNVLGECEVQGFRVYGITHYLPPRGQGPVKSREFVLEDLSLPNRLGTAAELFKHPLLLLPTLYHEYLHAEGFHNEAEVHLREVLFLRSLIAELAPPDSAELPGWESQVLLLLLDAGRHNLIQWLGVDWDRPTAVSLINDYINQVYGSQLGEVDARAKAEAERDTVNAWGCTLNTHEQVLGWCPEKVFPTLSGRGSTERSRKVGERLVEIVIRRSTTPRTIHTMSEVVARGGEAVRQQITAWEAYRHRPHAFEVVAANSAIVP
jgi:hypothetical protein